MRFTFKNCYVSVNMYLRSSCTRMNHWNYGLICLIYFGFALINIVSNISIYQWKWSKHFGSHARNQHIHKFAHTDMHLKLCECSQTGDCLITPAASAIQLLMLTHIDIILCISLVVRSDCAGKRSSKIKYRREQSNYHRYSIRALFEYCIMHRESITFLYFICSDSIIERSSLSSALGAHSVCMCATLAFHSTNYNGKIWQLRRCLEMQLVRILIVVN